MKKLLELNKLNTEIQGKPILKNVDLTINSGELHVLMGPNGSGKSTLAYALLGHPNYATSANKLIFDGKNISKLSTDKRARLGIFLGFQYPLSISGVSLTNLLPMALAAQQPAKRSRATSKNYLSLASAINHERRLAAENVRKELGGFLKKLAVDEEILYRSVNEGFSGGEKKKSEIMQMVALKPRLAILDEPDSGLDIDALKKIAHAIHEMHQRGTAVLLITHYQRILKYLKPDSIHIMNEGTIVTSGGLELVRKIETSGYAAFQK